MGKFLGSLLLLFFLAWASCTWYLFIAAAQSRNLPYCCLHWFTAERIVSTVFWTSDRLPDA